MTYIWMGGTKVFLQNIAQSVMLPMYNAYASRPPFDVKENRIDQTKLPSSIAPWSSNDALVATVGTFSSGWGHNWAP